MISGHRIEIYREEHSLGTAIFKRMFRFNTKVKNLTEVETQVTMWKKMGAGGNLSKERLKYFPEFKGDQKVSLEGAVTLEPLPKGPHPMINSIRREVNQSASRDFLFHGHPALC